MQQPQLSHGGRVPSSEETVHPPLPSPGQLQAGPPETPTRKGRPTHVPAIRGIQGWHAARKAPSRKDKVSCERFVHGRDYPEAFLHEFAAFSVCVSGRSGNNQRTEAPGLPLQIQCDRNYFEIIKYKEAAEPDLFS